MLLRLAAAYAAGLALRGPSTLPRTLAAAAVLVLAAAAWRGRRPCLAWGWLPGLLLALGLGALEPRLDPMTGPDGEVQVLGWIAARPEPGARGAAAVLVVESVRGDDNWLRPGQRLHLRSATALPAYGARCAVQGRLRARRGPRNFAAFDERSFLAARGVVAVLEAERVVVQDGVRGAAWRRQLIEPLRTLLARRLEGVLAPAPAGIVAALVLGLDGGIPPELAETWRALGMAHVLVISGMHVGFVAAMLLACAGSPRRPRGLLVLLGGVGLYAALGGLGASVLRASAMVAWSAVALYLGRSIRGLGALGLAAATLVVGAPELRHDLGLQLSCLSTAGILLWARPLQRLTGRWRGRRLGMLWTFLVSGAGISCAAQLATLPLVVARFGYVALAGIATSLTLVPLANLALVLGLAGALLALLSAALARPLWLLAGALVHGVNVVATAWMQLGEPRWFVSSGTVVTCLVVAACGTLLAAPLVAGRRRLVCLATATSTGLAFVALAQRPALPTWRLEALDVGQGDALLLSLGRDNWLVDCGDARPSDQGQRTVLPHLRRLGIDRLRGLVLTHPHRDHYGGAASLLRAVAVETLYVAEASRHAPAYAELCSTGVATRALRAGQRLALSDGYEALVLWPQAADSMATGANGLSLVLWMHGEGMPQLLAMGDLEALQEEALLRRGASTFSSAAPAFLVLKVGHHGSRTSSTPAFLAAIDAEVALISAGAGNRHGHPAPSTLAALERSGCVVLRTDQGGAIRLLLRGETLWLERPAARPRLLQAAAERRTAPVR